MSVFPSSAASGGPRTPFVKRLSSRLLGDRLGRRLARGALAAFAVNILGMAVALLSQLVLARVLGVEGYGVYAYVLGWVNLLVVPAMLGLNMTQLRYVAAYRTRDAWGPMGGIMAFGDRLVVVAGLGCSLLGILIVWLLHERLTAPLAETFYIGLLIVPALALVRTRAAAVRALGRILSALVPDLLTRHLALLIIVGLLIFLAAAPISPGMVMLATLASVLLALVTVSYSRARAYPPAAEGVAPVFERRTWLTTAMPLLFLACAQIVTNQASLLMLGWLGTTTEAGIYAVVARLSGFTVFPLSIVSFVFAPVISQLFADGKSADLQRSVTMTAWWTTAGAIAIGLPLVLFSGFLLGLFGDGFAAGATALRILLLGCLFHAMTGSIGLLMTMTGLERLALLISACAALTNVTLNLVLIPRFGIEGAAVAAAAGVVVWNTGAVIVNWRRHGIVGGIFASVLK